MQHKQRKIKTWKEVVKYRAAGLSMPKIGLLTGLTKQRVFSILKQTEKYAAKYDDDLATFIKENTK